jgi:hypothetical protein
VGGDGLKAVFQKLYEDNWIKKLYIMQELAYIV